MTDQKLFDEFLMLQYDNETKVSQMKLRHVDTRVLLPGIQTYVVEGQISVSFLLRI